MGINIPEVGRQKVSKALIVIANVRFGSFAAETSHPRYRAFDANSLLNGMAEQGILAGEQGILSAGIEIIAR